MAAVLQGGHKNWRLTRDEDGHRDYKVNFLVRCLAADGPAIAVTAPGLPEDGSVWQIQNDLDEWAWCRKNVTVTPVKKDEANNYFDLEYTFSTKPLSRCQDVQIEDPLLIPYKISFAFTKYQLEVSYDRFGVPIMNSAWEVYRGPQVEFDQNRPTVKIEQNVADMQLDLLYSMQDTVNDRPLWGFPARCVKFSMPSAERKFYGTCSIYYARTLEFEIRSESFDRDLLDFGSLVLNGHWDQSGNWHVDPIGVTPPPEMAGFLWSSGGSITGTNGTVCYQVTAVTLQGETLPSDRNCTTKPPFLNTVTIFWNPVPGAIGYNIYGRADTNPINPLRLLGVALGNAVSYTDDGSLVPSGALPTKNTAIILADPNNPSHFKRATDRQGNVKPIALNGHGLPANADVGTGSGAVNSGIGKRHTEVYRESNFFLLAIPPDLTIIFP